MLIKCPECELQVSDKALSCPHCGYPLVDRPKQYKRRSKVKRLPNGFGQITELKNQNLRNPFRAMVTVGKTDTGRPISKLLKPKSYFRTYNEAYEALVEYHKNPYDLDTFITVKELYEKWSESYFATLKSAASTRTVTAAWRYCSSVYNLPAKDLRARHVKYCIDNGFVNINGETHYPSAGTKSRIKSMFNLMMDYAVEYEIVDKNYARTFNVSDEIIDEQKKAYRSHMPFTDEEMQILWDHSDDYYTAIILIQCYSGWRPQELGNIKLCDVNMVLNYFEGGMKTEAGKNRIVPIHEKIYGLVLTKYQQAEYIGSEYLFNCIDSVRSRELTYDKYQKRFNKIIKYLGLNPEHRPHDGRVHFVTMAKKYNVDEYAIKYMAGHAITDLTERVYTKRDIAWLTEEMKKIK